MIPALRMYAFRLAICFSLGACGGDEPPVTLGPVVEPRDESWSYAVPDQLDDGWTTAHAEGVGLGVARLEDMYERIRTGGLVNVHSVLVIKDGLLVAEGYFPGTDVQGQFVQYDRETLHGTHSVTKSWNSALIGIAVRQGLISDLDAPLASFFPDYTGETLTPAQQVVTLRSALAMSAGLDWDEWSYPYGDARNDHYVMDNSAHPIEYVLSRELAVEPGSRFVYNSGLALSLGGVIRAVSGLYAEAFARQHLFGPLGVADFTWWKYPDGTTHTGGGLRLKPRDMAKLGQLYLDEGVWNGTRLLDRAWVEASRTNQTADFRYGYQWWLNTYTVNGRQVKAYFATGLGGQYVYVIEDYDVVVVITQANTTLAAPQALEILNGYVLAEVVR